MNSLRDLLNPQLNGTGLFLNRDTPVDVTLDVELLNTVFNTQHVQSAESALPCIRTIGDVIEKLSFLADQSWSYGFDGAFCICESDRTKRFMILNIDGYMSQQPEQVKRFAARELSRYESGSDEGYFGVTGEDFVRYIDAMDHYGYPYFNETIANQLLSRWS